MTDRDCIDGCRTDSDCITDCDFESRISVHDRTSLTGIFVTTLVTTFLFMFLSMSLCTAYVTAVSIEDTMPALSSSGTASFLTASISLEKYYYRPGELVNISLEYPSSISDDMYMEIYPTDNPEYLYRYLDLDGNNVLFSNENPGEYVIRLYLYSNDDSVSLLSEKRFIVYGTRPENCSTYSVGDAITIDLTDYSEKLTEAGIRDIGVGDMIGSDVIGSDVMESDMTGIDKVYLLYHDLEGNPVSELRYGDVLNNIVYFSASNAGIYELLVNDVYVDCYDVKTSVYDHETIIGSIGSITDGASANDTGSNTGSSDVIGYDGISGYNDILGYIGSDDLIKDMLDNDGYDVSSQELFRDTMLKRYFEEKDAGYVLRNIGSQRLLSPDDSERLSQLLTENRDSGISTVSIKDRDGKFQNTYVVLRNNRNGSYSEGSLIDINDKRIPSDAVNHNMNRYQADIYFSDSTVKKIRLNDLDYSAGIDMDFEDISVEDLTMTRSGVGSRNDGSRGDFLDVFAINPERMGFRDAIVTFTATGNALWKCKEYDFSTRTCYGDFVKILDMVPGLEYSFILTPEDPVFAQSNYLINPTFNINITSGWVSYRDSRTPLFTWVNTDSVKSGIASIYQSARGANYIGSYYQTFNLSVPTGTQLVNVTFKASWRINAYTSANPGSVYLWIQNASNNVTSCNYQQTFSSTTAWTDVTLNTNGSNGCFLSNFTANRLYNIRLRCNLVTLGGGGTKNVSCLWDDVNITAFYIDVQSPNISYFNDTPDPVNYANVINFTANITDNIQLDKIWITIDNTNYTMNYQGTGMTYYFDAFNTSIYPKLYYYSIYSNDTSNNTANFTGNFTINDSINPRLYMMGPENGIYSNISNNYFYYNVSDESFIQNCSLRIDGSIVSTNTSVQKDIQQSFNRTLSNGVHYWNITCYDNSTNKNANTSIVRNITVDTVPPNVALNYPGNNNRVSGGASKNIYFNYTPADANLNNCSIYGNFTVGGFLVNQTNSTPVNGSMNQFMVYLVDGAYSWNVKCCDKAGNCAFNATNLTVYVDSAPPYWSNNMSYPANGSIWTYPRNYQFNITWSDISSNVSSAWIEHNFSGVLQNHSVSNLSNIYYYDIANLAAGSYMYRWYANDTLNNLNYTGYYTYTIDKAPSTIQLLLNGSDSDMDIGEGDSVNIAASLIVPSAGYIELYQDGIMINSGSSPLTNITSYSLQRRYNITASYPATQNYSFAYSTHFVTVTDTLPPKVALGNPDNFSWNPRTVSFYYTPTDNIDIVNCTLILDGMDNVTQNSTIGVPNSFTINVSDGTHNWTVGCGDSRGNYGQNETVKYVRVDTFSPQAFILLTPNNNTISNNNTPLLNWTQTIEANFLNYTIQVDNNPNFLVVDYVYTGSNVTDTTYQVPNANPWGNSVWYWRVIAYDLVYNNYTTGHYLYIVDTSPPVVNILSPDNDHYSNNLVQYFNFTITDSTEIVNCSLYLNDILDQTNNSVNKSLTQSFMKTFASQGVYNWSISCFDQASNRQATTVRYLYIDQTAPTAFSLVAPSNGTLSNNNTPLFNWSQTMDTYFSNYELEISDDNSFIYTNYTYIVTNITDTNYAGVPLSDTVWYWHVTAYDRSGNNYTAGSYSYAVDTIPPAEFFLVSPVNMTSGNITPLLEWTQTSDMHFVNYTIQVSDDAGYSHVNFTYINSNISNTSYQASGWPMNNVWYWRVIASDNASNNHTTGSYSYITDNSTPRIFQVSPLANSLWNTTTIVLFVFNVSDISLISNCSLIVNGNILRIVTDVERGTDQTIYEGLSNGQYAWSINCTDAAGYTSNSSFRNLTVNVTLPAYRFYETSTSAVTSLPNPAQVNLSTQFDLVENYVQATVSGVDYNIANASIAFNGSGFLIYPNTRINFSGVFQATTRNAGYVNWGVYIQNSSGTSLICQTAGGTSGSLITTRNAKETEVGSCTSPNYNIRFNAGDRLLLRVNVYSGSSVTYMHYMDNTNPSFLQLDGYKLGILNVTLINTTDQQPGEGYAFMEQCNVTCNDGYCLDSDLHYEINNSFTQNFIMIGDTGNIILNGSQYNPDVLGTINHSIVVNASLFANNYSFNNTFRCYAESLYSNSASNTKNITVRDITSPAVGLMAPGPAYAADPGVIEFHYLPYDKRLDNCTIYTNVTGSWSPNQTNSTPSNNGPNYFYINFTDYGQYIWNVMCCDMTGNCASNDTTRTLNIAGNLAILPGGVYFSNDRPPEGETITVFAKITNLANRIENNVLVRFYEGDPDIDGVQTGPDVYLNITALANKTVNISWTASKGTHDIYAKVDPMNTIVESDDENNKGHNMTFTSVWQTYYGNVSLVMQRLGAGNSSFMNWSLQSGFDGNIYVTDIDSSVSWTTLNAITRDLYDNINADTLDDFEDIDTCLSMESYIDNINSTYSLNGQPVMTSTYDIYNVLVAGVPDVPSTNNTNFYSGILWDYGDSVDDYYSCQGVPSSREDLVFVTKINENKEGSKGLYDYELRVPGNLGDYKGTDNGVALYYEIK